MLSKKFLLISIIVIQAGFIVFLAIAAIGFRNEAIRARAEANHYHNELTTLHEDNDAVLTRILMKEREDLRHEYFAILEVAARHGTLIKGVNE